MRVTADDADGEPAAAAWAGGFSFLPSRRRSCFPDRWVRCLWCPVNRYSCRNLSARLLDCRIDLSLLTAGDAGTSCEKSFVSKGYVYGTGMGAEAVASLDFGGNL
ncbi:hypothetical protein HPB50_021298 [Hyalomma asiaticum]|uniref:Uncharacterized protein n=1 Tax=Hyalomma asiaticum TaxID=266040 RepID=A0ACB7SUF0_HYAAI|nr:hypothetical protein HPB50_021298 [Hyalomma asiaticum]